MIRCSSAVFYSTRQQPSTSSITRSWAGVGLSFSFEVLRMIASWLFARLLSQACQLGISQAIENTNDTFPG